MWYWFLSLMCRLYAYTWRVSTQEKNPVGDRLSAGGIIICWHGDLFPLLMTHRNQNIVPIVSRSSDGELLTRLLSRLGYECIRGSSSVGGKEAFAAAQKVVAQGSIVAFAVDGPKGPPFQLKAGAVGLARLLHCGLLAMAVTASPCKYFASWDKFILPWPFAKVRLRYLYLTEESMQSGQFEQKRLEVEKQLRNLSLGSGRLLDG